MVGSVNRTPCLGAEERDMKIRSFILLMLIAAIWGCGSRVERTLPTKLIGIWETRDSRFDGRSFEITEDMIIFSNRHQDFIERNRIITIKKSNEKDKTEYQILYKNHNGDEYQFSFYYRNNNGQGSINLKNRDDIKWTRKKISSS